ncbi:MAG: hypothetical protein IPL99_26240 [Candidatus Competibacteraceae bacterium]|nr:hypothetical protein [Candidatus Competibacteraceae bacterium]
MQRVMTDFGADDAFGRVPGQAKEHYGIEMPVSTIQRTTEHHAHCRYDREAAREIRNARAAAAGVIHRRAGWSDGAVAVSHRMRKTNAKV